MNIYTFYQPFDKTHTPLVEYWTNNWKQHGYTVNILNMSHVHSHPLYPHFLNSINRLPTVNGRQYENSCYLRWLALDKVGGGFLIDYDIINYGVTNIEIKNDIEMHGGLWGLVYAEGKGLCGLINEIMHNGLKHSIEINGKPHVSDMLVGMYYSEMNYRKDIKHFAPCPGHKQTLEKPMCLHYSNTWRHIYGAKLSRLHAIQKFEKENNL